MAALSQPGMPRYGRGTYCVPDVVPPPGQAALCLWYEQYGGPGSYVSAQIAAVAVRVAERQQHVGLERSDEVATDALAAVGHRTALPSREAGGDGAGRRHSFEKFGKFK